MLKQRFIHTIGIALLTGTIMGQASAVQLTPPGGHSETGAPSNSGLPSYFPSNYQKIGKISMVHSGVVTIDSLKYHLSPNVLVHSTSSEFLTYNALSQGDEIGFSYTESTRGMRTITEIWILPKGSVPLL